MKRLSFFLCLALLVSFGLANAGQISIDGVVGEWEPGKIKPNAPVTFNIRINQDNPTNAQGITNAYRVWVAATPGGAAGAGTFTPLEGAWTDLAQFQAWFDLVLAINQFSDDGVGNDTIGFGGSKGLSGNGIPPGYNDVAYTITTGGVAEGLYLCIDSSYYRPTGTWLWAPGGPPSWSGQMCLLAETPPCLPPVITNAPTSLNGSHCDLMTFDFDATVEDQDPPNPITGWTASIGSITPAGVWSYQPTLADVGASVSVDIVVLGTGCDSDPVTVNLNFSNEAPAPDCPATVSVSTGATEVIQLEATDDCDPFSWTLVDVVPAGPTVAVTPDGELSFASDIAGLFTVTVEVSDGDEAATCDIDFDVIAGSLYQVKIPCVGEQDASNPDGFVHQGQYVDIPVELAAQGGPIGGYDLLISYDASALSFQGATLGADLLGDWEYFTYRFGPNGNCGNACPSGMLRLIAIAETNNGPNHAEIFTGISELAVMKFLVTSDATFQCQLVPINFFWFDCGDNALSSQTGNELLVAEAVYATDWDLNPPLGTNIYDPTVGYPTTQGPQDDCGSGDKEAVHTVSFHNGCVWIACADSIDARGDINLNNVDYEIADAVLLSRYFVYGVGVFTINMPGQIAASDVNADGLTLSVADLVYLIRVIQGDALPYPKLNPENITVTTSRGMLVSNDELGAAVITYDGNVVPELLAEGMDMMYAYDAEARVTRVLVYSATGNTFSGAVVSANGNIVSTEFATPEGAVATAKVLPADYELAQNYPNPFNPATTIGFSLPTNAEVTLTVFNITGQKVFEHVANYEAGSHQYELNASQWSSGIYFYKLSANSFTKTMKMVLLK